MPIQAEIIEQVRSFSVGSRTQTKKMEVDKREKQEIFQDATQFVRKNSQLFDSDALLFLYSRYKQVNTKPFFTSFDGFKYQCH